MTCLREVVAGVRGSLSGTGATGALARGGLGAFLAAVVSAGTGALVQMLVARMLGANEFGIYAYALAWVNFLVVFAVAGYDTAALRFVAAYRATEQWGLLRGFMRQALMVPAGLALVLGVAGGAVALATGSGGGLWVAVGAAVLLPLLVLLRLMASYLQGFRQVVRAQTVQGILRPIVIGVFLLGATFGLGLSATAELAVGLNLVVTGLICLVTLWAVRAAVRGTVGTEEARYERELWARTARPLLMIGAAQVLLLSTDTLVIGLLLGTREAGLYSVASQLSTAVTLAITAVNGILAPLISELHASGRREELQRVLTMSARAVVAYAAPVAVILMLFGGPLLGLYGAEFREGWGALSILAIGQLAIAAFGSVGFLMTMTGHERAASLVIGASALTNLVLNFALVPWLGISGAALATTLSVAGRSMVLMLFVRRRIGLRAGTIGGFGRGRV